MNVFLKKVLKNMQKIDSLASQKNQMIKYSCLILIFMCVG